jgi:hypothetical protein
VLPDGRCNIFARRSADSSIGEYRATDGGVQAAADLLGRVIMTLCPVALAVGCIKCPVFKICPVKGIIGDYKKHAPPPADLKKKQ